MRMFLFLIMAFGPTVHAGSYVVICSNDKGASMRYDGRAETFEFNLGIEAPAGVVSMRGAHVYKNNINSDYSNIIFVYPLTDGRYVEITWLGQDSEVLRGTMPVPESAVVKRGDRVLQTFSVCYWR